MRAAASAPILAVAMAVAVAATPAAAQLLPPEESVRFTRYTAVREREIPGYEVRGLPLGPFQLSPSVDISPNYTDNVFAIEDPRVDDGFLRVAPAVQARADWRTRSLTLSADGTFDRYFSRSSENADAVNLSAYGVQQFGGDTRARLLGRFRAGRESRESQNAFVLTERPIEFTSAVAAIGASHRFNRVLISGEAGYQQDRFANGLLMDGSPLDQDYRDGEVTYLRARGDYNPNPAIAFFGQASRASSSFGQRSSTGLRRGAETTELLGGARFELPVLVRGEIGLGYIESTYRDDRLRRFSGLAIDSRVTYFPTQLTTVSANLRRSVNDAGTPDSSTYVAFQGGAGVDHELRRWLILFANVQFERDEFNGVDRRDDRLAVSAGADFRIARTWTLRVNLDRLDVSSEGTQRYKSFTRNRALVGLGFRI